MKHSRTEALLAAALIAATMLGCSAGDESPTLPSGTPLIVALSATSRSDWNETGETLSGSLAEDVLVDGKIVLHAGQSVTLAVLEAQPAMGDDPARLQLGLESIDFLSGSERVSSEPLDIVGEASHAAEVIGDELAEGEAPAETHMGSMSGVLRANYGTTVTIESVGDAVVLPAGQRLEFVIRDAMKLERLETASNQS